MALALKWFAEGQLPNAEGDLYAAGATVGIKTIILVNVSAAVVTISLFVKRGGGASRRICDKDLSLAINEALVLDFNVVLENGDALRGVCSAATSVDYTVFGFTE